MPTCKFCGQSGWFLSLISGICKQCHAKISIEVPQRVRIINESMALIRNSKNLDTQLSRCDLIIAEAKAMLPYEVKGVKTCDPPPSAFIQVFEDEHDKIILKSIDKDLDEMDRKQAVVDNYKSLINQLSKLILKIQDYKPKLKDFNNLDAYQKVALTKLQELQLKNFLDGAKKAEFKGQNKKALDLYYEALYFLKGEDIDESFKSDNMSKIEQKIIELGGQVRVSGEN